LTVVVYLALFALFAYQVYQIYQVNKDIFKHDVPELHRYKFKQVAVLDLAYLTTFGAELATVSMLPLFFSDMFEISAIQAGLLASAFAFMNLVSRPLGGLFSDKLGRKRTLSICITGLAIGYCVMSMITAEWALVFAVLTIMACAFFVQAGSGAVFAVVPLVQRRLTGQVAGMAGAYANVGGVVFLTALSVVSTQTFFYVIAATAVLTLIAVQFMDEPSGQMAEVLPDGSVQMIDVH
jgi:NNP family nitrate/nitrite transporter-like MFS transporter